jgi:hypothetical protein
MALAEATKGAAEWDGLGLLSGSSINDITTTLSIFGSQYSTEHEFANCYDGVQELPDLTDEDIEWLCGLTEATESPGTSFGERRPRPVRNATESLSNKTQQTAPQRQ